MLLSWRKCHRITEERDGRSLLNRSVHLPANQWQFPTVHAPSSGDVLKVPRDALPVPAPEGSSQLAPSHGSSTEPATGPTPASVLLALRRSSLFPLVSSMSILRRPSSCLLKEVLSSTSPCSSTCEARRCLRDAILSCLSGRSPQCLSGQFPADVAVLSFMPTGQDKDREIQTLCHDI